MFGLLSKRKRLTVHNVGHIIERFLNNSPRYPQEWNDFVDTAQRSPNSERLRRRCYDLDPLVNVPGQGDGTALAELRMMAASARKETYLDVAKTLEDFVNDTGGRWDWDVYTSAMSYEDDPYLQDVQRRMVYLDTEFPSGGNGYCGAEGIEVIRAYVRDLRNRASQYVADVGVHNS
jgi:hypothetical protein